MLFPTAAYVTLVMMASSIQAAFVRQASPPPSSQCSPNGPEQTGDVLIELPGKAGFMQMPDVFGNESMSTEMKETYGIGTDDVLPIEQIVDIFTSYLKYPMPNASRARLTQSIDFFTTARAGAVVCDAYENTAGWYNRQWRPYNDTMGWHYAIYSRCSPSEGWVGFGSDPSVDLTILYDSYGEEAVVQQKFKDPNAFTSADASGVGFIYLQSRIAKAGKLSESEHTACCFPASEEERDCSAVHRIVDAYKVS